MITTPTVVLACTCVSEFQDKEYGKGMRLHNVSQGGTNKGKMAYCTVCCPRQPIIKQNTSPMPAIGMTSMQFADPARKGKAV